MDTITLDNIEGMANNNWSRAMSAGDRLDRIVTHLTAEKKGDNAKTKEPAPHPSILSRINNANHATDYALTGIHELIGQLEAILSCGPTDMVEEGVARSRAFPPAAAAERTR